MRTDTQEKAALHGSLASDAFRSRYKELLASFDPGQVGRALVGYIRLHLRDEIAGVEPDLTTYLAHTERAFLALLDSKKIAPVAPITSLGQTALDAMRRRTGIHLPGQEPIPTPPQLTPREEMEARVIDDFRRLSTKEIRARVANDKKYRETFYRLGEENRLEGAM